MWADLELLIKTAMAEWRIPGLAIAVVHHDEPVLVKGFGERDVEAAFPVTTETQFLLCSITKSFTATGLAMLADERRLDWASPCASTCRNSGCTIRSPPTGSLSSIC